MRVKQVLNGNLAITRCCVLTPLGDTAATWEGLCAGTRVGERREAAAVAEELLEGDVEWDRSIRLGLAVAKAVLGRGENGNPKSEIRNPKEERVGLFCGTSKGPVGVMLGAYDKVRRGVRLGEAEARQVALGVGAMGVLLRDRLGLKGAAHTSVAACSSGIFALHRAAEAIAHGECERALVVAADASLYPVFEGSFQRLGVLAKTGTDGVRRCEPYGEEGEAASGFFVSEAAAAVMLERGDAFSEKQAQRDPSAAGHGTRQDPAVWLERSWVGGDGTGLVAVDDQMRGLRAGLREFAGELEFVQGHGTGTGHDALEAAAVRDVLGIERGAGAGGGRLFSHKKWLGHSLGAAGLVGVVISAMSHRHGRLPTGEQVAAGGGSVTIAQGFGGHIGIIGLRGS